MKLRRWKISHASENRSRNRKSHKSCSGLLLFNVMMMLTGLLICIEAVSAQDEKKADEQIEAILNDVFLQKDNSVFVPVPRDMLRPLIRANRAIRGNEIARAVTMLGEVLSESTDEDFLIPTGVYRGVSISLRSRAEAVLGSLSSKDRDLYRLRYNVQAKQMLQKAIEEGDFEQVSQVMQRFFFTRAGYDAAMILGHYHLDEGRVVAAANCFSKVCDAEEARLVHDPEASVLLAMCCMLTNSPSRATKALENLRQRTQRTTIQFQGNPVKLFGNSDEPLVWLRELIGNSPLVNIEIVSQWVMVGGNPQRNARSGTGFPLINSRWSVPTLNDPDLEKSIIEKQRELIFQDTSPIPAVQPLAVGDTIVMRAFDRMIGVDFKTGKRKWVFPPWDFASQFDEPQERMKARTIAVGPLAERMWEDSLYGQASSDGHRIFFIPSPGFTASASASSGNLGEAGKVVYRPYNELKAIDIDREGAFLWEVGGETGLGEPKLAKTFFLGSPLPLNDELYAVCQVDKEVRLVVLDSETGRLVWEQRLGTTENSRDIRTDRYRRLRGVMCSASDGLLVCSTGNGALVAVDLSTRSLVWGYQYTTPGRRNIDQISHIRKSNSDPFDGLWRDTSVVIAEGKVFFTPVDSLDLICVEVQSGRPGFRDLQGNESAKANRDDGLFLACVEQGRAVIVGDTNLRAIDVQTGQTIWTCPLENNGKPSGRGYANRGHYYLPTSLEKVVKVNLETGTLEKVVDTDGILGNLICYQGEVISHGAERLAVFPQDEPFRDQIIAAEQAGDLSASQLAIKSQLQIQDGNLDAAIESLKKSYQLAPTRTTKKRLMKLVLRLIESDFKLGMTVAQPFEEQLNEEHRFELLVARVNGMVRDERSDFPIQMLFDILAPENTKQLAKEFLQLSKAQFDNTGEFEKRSDWSNDQAVIRLDRWVASRISLLFQKGDKETRDTILQGVTKFCETYSDANPLSRYEAIRVFDLAWIDESCRLTLAKNLADLGEHVRAKHLLLTLVGSSNASIAGQAVAEQLAATGHYNEVPEQNLTLINKLANEFADVAVSDGKSGSELALEYMERLGLSPDGIEPQVKWIRGKVIPNASSVSAALSRSTASTVELQECDDPSIASYRFMFHGQTGELEVIDPFGRTLYRFLARKKIAPTVTRYNQNVFGRISVLNNVAVMDIATELFVIDWLKVLDGTDPVIWNTAVAGSNFKPINAMAKLWGEARFRSVARYYENRIHVCRAGLDAICYLDKNQLIGLDPHTGERLWERTTQFPKSTISGDAGNVIVFNSKMRVANVFDPRTGMLKATTHLPDDVGGIWKERGRRVLVSQSRPKVPMQAGGLDNDASEDEDKNGDEKKNSVELIKMLGLYDLVDQKFVWQKEFPMTTRACAVEYTGIALLHPDGMLKFLEIRTGDVNFEIPTGLSPAIRKNLTGIGVEKRNGKYLVHLKRGQTPNRLTLPGRAIELRYLNYTDAMWVGYLICADPVSGKAVWERPVRFDNFQIVQNQPDRLPFYLLSRRVLNKVDSSLNYLQLTGIDLETGQTAVNHLATYSSNVSFSIECDMSSQSVTVHYDKHEIVFNLSENHDGPPQPVAYLTNSNSIPPEKIEYSRQLVAKEIWDKEKAVLLQQAKEFQKKLDERRQLERERLEKEKQ